MSEPKLVGRLLTYLLSILLFYEYLLSHSQYLALGLEVRGDRVYKVVVAAVLVRVGVRVRVRDMVRVRDRVRVRVRVKGER